MNVHEAEQACEDAVEEHTVAARYIYQYGRALDEDRDGNAYERATDQFQESAELNYPAAWYQLGKRGVMWRTQHPKELLQDALKQGVIPAVTALAAGSANNEEMLHWLHQGEELGDPEVNFIWPKFTNVAAAWVRIRNKPYCIISGQRAASR